MRYRFPYLSFVVLFVFLPSLSLLGKRLDQEHASRAERAEAHHAHEEFQPWDVCRDALHESQVTIKRSRSVHASCTFDTPESLYCVKIEPGLLDVYFIDCTFRGASKKGLVGEGFTAQRCTFEDIASDGIFVTQGGHFRIVGCKFRRLGYDPQAPAPGLDRWGKPIHADAVQVAMGAHGTILNNYFQVPHLGDVGGPVSNSCIFVEYDPQFGAAVRDIEIRGNTFDGGLYSVWVIGNTRDGVDYYPKDVRLTGNLFGRHYYGATRIDERSEVEQEGNDYSQAERYRPRLLPPDEEIERVLRRAG